MTTPVRLDEAIDTAVDEQQIEALDFPITCQVQVQHTLTVKTMLGSREFPLGISEPCAEPAVSMITCTVCGSDGFVCGEHEAYVRGAIVSCGNCDTCGPGSTLYRFSPLGGE